MNPPKLVDRAWIDTTSKTDRLLVQKTQMGTTEAYLGAVTLEWLARRVGFASQLPLFQPHLDRQTQNVERGTDTAETIIQRPLDWSRQAPLAQYLATRPSHKFPPLLVVLSPEWVDDSLADEWDLMGKATRSSADFLPLDGQNSAGWLSIPANVSVYALDGQHRLMGVQGLLELIETGQLQPYNKTKKPTGKPIALDDLAQTYQLDLNTLKNLSQETIGVELIPAVVSGETRDQARRRVRSIFVHVNLMAVPLSKGQLALLDEDDGFSIVARHAAVSHSLLKDQPGRHPRVNWDSATVAAKSTVLTTLQALKDMAAKYLQPKFPHWKPDKYTGLLPLRPEEDELEAGLLAFGQFLDGLASLPSYRKLTEGRETAELRRFSFEKPEGEGNLLFRPVGQIAVAQGLGWLIHRLELPLDTAIAKLQRYDTEGGFSELDNPRSLWYGVLYDPNKRRIRVAGRDLAAKLLVYLLGGMGDRLERANLRKLLAQSRTFENKAISFQGRFVSPKDVGLPDVL